MTDEVAALLETLKDEDERHFRFVFDRIKQIGKPAHEPILQAFNHSDLLLRFNLIFLMSQLRDAVFIAPLVAAMQDKNERIQASAAYALGLIAEKAASGALVAALRKGSPELRRNAAWALGEIKDPETVEALIDALADNNVHVQEEVIVALGAIQDKRAIDPLKGMIRSKVTRLVEYAFQALLQFGTDILDFLIGLLESPKESIDTQHHALWCIGKLRDERAIEVLTKVLARNDERLTAASIEALGNINDIRIVPILIPYLGKAIYVTKISESIIRLGSSSFEILVAALDKHEDYVRVHLVTILGKLKDGRALEVLLSLLNDKEPRVRFATISALGDLGDKRAVKSLLALLSSENREWREEAANSLGKQRDSRALEALMIALMDKEKTVRIAAVRALGRLEQKKAVPLLVGMLKGDEPYNVQVEALNALSQIADDWAVPAIAYWLEIHQSKGRSEFVSFAVETLRKIGSPLAMSALQEAGF